ncbi:hypothetical protein [Alkalicoccobacillus plakortidis]|uniref:Uncharacterized protein n=1 Tax=Alkalicoccobacillus plakortidis TaxID=444060 RepID=A0ABT0XIZ3_9BACI|nr:hypothetical protein [Alkalicoccobacillus plakortidis]MCM2675720.1 hypothetical protein [Alkalicoccobacillus plakortidis]
MKRWYQLFWSLLALLFLSGFFFLDQETEQPESNEPQTVTIDEEGLIAIRLNHAAAAFKTEQLRAANLPEERVEKELVPYIGQRLLEQAISWVKGEDVPEIDALISVDISGQPVVVDEHLEGEISIDWSSEQHEHVTFTYHKPADYWLLEQVEKKGVRG